MTRLVVLRGGTSMERDISFVTGNRVQHALERLGHEVHPLDIEDATTGALMEIAPEAAFVCLHGPGGEDGTVQALLETLGIPYTGSGPLSSIRCMDKDYAKRAARAAGVPTPPFRTFFRRAMNEMGAAAALDTAADTLGYPLAVKPAREGSSFGLSRVEEPEGLLDAVYEAFGYDAKILLERWVEGAEISVPVLEPAGEEPGPSGWSRSGRARATTTSRPSTPRARPTSPSRPRSHPNRRPTWRRRPSRPTAPSAAPATRGWTRSSPMTPPGSST